MLFVLVCLFVWLFVCLLFLGFCVLCTCTHEAADIETTRKDRPQPGATTIALKMLKLG